MNSKLSRPASRKVSLIIPTRNEEKYISQTIESLLQQNYPPSSLEILLVDGMSTDRTRDIIRRYTQRFSFIRIIDNPRMFTNHAFNLGVQHSSGDFVVIMGAHTHYSPNYISTISKYLTENGEYCVGSVAETIPGKDTFTARAIAQALSCRFGVGNSLMRTGTETPVYADTASCTGYRKEVFEKVGLFNESLSYSQDMEFHLRMKKAGYKILLLPEIKSYYHARPDLKSFLRHNFRNGLWVILPFIYAEVIPISLRHLVPLVFISTLLLSLLLSAWIPSFLYFFGFIILLYAGASLFFSGRIAILKKNPKFLLVLPPIFFLLHLTYGLGSLWGLFNLCFSRKFWRNISTLR